MNVALLVLLLAVVAGLTFVGAWRFMGAPMRQFRREERARAELPQIPPDDEYTICPVCHLMGRHTRELVERQPRVLESGIVVDYIGPTKFYVRTCAFYPEHTWGAPYRGEDA